MLASILILTSSWASYGEPSPMAKLMQKMLSFLKTEKENTTENQEKVPYPALFKKIHSAKITKTKKLHSAHDSLAADFLHQLNSYYVTQDTITRKMQFNAMVESCIRCHELECPGPIQTIRKIRIP